MCRDFPGGEGESAFVGRATVRDIGMATAEGRRMCGFERVEAGSGSGSQGEGEGKGEGHAEFVEKANGILFGEDVWI